MSKTKDKTIDQQNEQNAALAELLTDGSTTLTADSRQALYKEAETLVGMIPKDVKWTRTIVIHDGTTFTQIYQILKQE